MQTIARSLLAVATSILAACSAPPASGEKAARSGVAVDGDTCVATFHFLQKDAYKNTAGRTSALWPPHTTTTLDVVCYDSAGGEETIADATMVNHGTAPGAKDANGEVFLVEVATRTTTGAREDLLDLVGQYQLCQCDDATTFLSMDALDAHAKDLLAGTTQYLRDNLECDLPDGAQTLVDALTQGDVEAAIADFDACTWASGADLDQALAEALDAILSGNGKSLDDYHVCNNDAALQAQLFDDFSKGGASYACNAASDVCHGPKFFYDVQ